MDFFFWLKNEQMLYNLLKKEVGAKDGMDSLLFKNRLEFAISHDNILTYKNGELDINRCKVLENLAPKPTKPFVRTRQIVSK